MNLRIGFIGLGIMGRHMASHLHQAGYPLVVHDIVDEAVQPLISLGAKRADNPSEAAAVSDIVITMLPDSPEVKMVALDRNGLIEAARPGLIFIDMSTIAPQVSMYVAEQLEVKGVRCLDAPVSGGQIGAQNATLSIMVGGPAELFHEMMPIFKVMGKNIVHCGPSGAGQTVKACNQIQVALNFVGMAEALVLGSRAGIDPEIVIKVLSGGYAQTRVMDVRGPRLIKGDFEPGFKSKFHYKDLNIILDTARELKIPLPATALAHELFSALLAQGNGELDHSAVIKVLESLAGVSVRSQKS